MAKNKIERIDQEITKVREKIAEYQEKLKALEAQKTEAENLEIVQMVRALRMAWSVWLWFWLTPSSFRTGMGATPDATKNGLRPFPTRTLKLSVVVMS